MITVFTPTYNRAHTISKLYNSLVGQSCFNFEWIIVDDGSDDNTEELVNSFLDNENRFPIQYCKQKNGGKHRAINHGVKLAKGEFFFIVDSDDYLTPDAIEKLEIELDNIRNDSLFCGVTALRIDPNGKVIGENLPVETLDTDFVSYRYKYNAKGDRAEVVKTDILKQYPFPEFENENFCTEAVVWYKIAQKYVTRFINLPIYVCEYLPNGLTDTYNRIMLKNPQGTVMYYRGLAGYRNVPIKDRLLAGVRYWQKYKKIEIPNDIIRPTFYLLICRPVFELLSYYVERKWSNKYDS